MGYSPTSIVDVRPAHVCRRLYAEETPVAQYYGKVTLREALSRSLNAATVDSPQTALASTPCGMYAQRLGVELDEADRTLALALGSTDTAPLPSFACERLSSPRKWRHVERGARYPAH